MLTTMAGVTTAILGFIFVCVIFPNLVRHRPQFYAALGALVAILLLDSIAHAVHRGQEGTGFHAFAYAMIALLQIVAILALFFSAGGIAPREVMAEMKRAIEVIRRGEEEKEVIIPIGDQARQPPPDKEKDEDRGL